MKGLKVFLRFLYAAMVYAVVILGMWLWTGVFVKDTTLFPPALYTSVLWMSVAREAVLLMGVCSYVMYVLWVLLVNGKLLGRYNPRKPENTKCSVWNWVFIVLHLALMLYLLFFNYGSVVNWLFSLVFSTCYIYYLPAIVFTIVFFFVSRIFSADSCYNFHYLWKLRSKLGL